MAIAMRGKVVIVTGASRGIGKQVAIELGRIDVLVNNAAATSGRAWST